MAKTFDPRDLDPAVVPVHCALPGGTVHRLHTTDADKTACGRYVYRDAPSTVTLQPPETVTCNSCKRACGPYKRICFRLSRRVSPDDLRVEADKVEEAGAVLAGPILRALADELTLVLKNRIQREKLIGNDVVAYVRDWAQRSKQDRVTAASDRLQSWLEDLLPQITRREKTDA